MRRLLLSVLLIGLCNVAGAVTIEDLTANTWMPATDSVPSCEIPATITFVKDGSFHSEPGCNNMFGQYKLGSNGSLVFENVGLTRKLCSKQYMELEQAFVSIINNTRYIEKDGKYLRLFDANKKPIGSLEPEKAGACG